MAELGEIRREGGRGVGRKRGVLVSSTMVDIVYIPPRIHISSFYTKTIF